MENVDVGQNDALWIKVAKNKRIVIHSHVMTDLRSLRISFFL